MGTNCAPLVADLFLFCYERDFMTSLSDVKQAEIIEAFKSTSRYLDDVTHRSTVARTVMCRQDGRGRFSVSLDDHSKCRTNSQRKSQLS